MFDTLNDVEKLANSLLCQTYQIDLMHSYCPTDKGYGFGWSNKKRALGTCYYGARMIRLSKPLVSRNLSNHEKIKDTILHEIAHAAAKDIYDVRGHGKRWKAVAKAIGADPTRCYTHEQIKSVPTKWTLICNNCGMTTGLHRLPRRVQDGIDKRSCGRCNPNEFDERYILEIRKNW